MKGGRVGACERGLGGGGEGPAGVAEWGLKSGREG